jgi:hypothetical protein
VRSKVAFALGASALATLAACSAIIGTRDLTLVDGDAGPGTFPDGGPMKDGTVGSEDSGGTKGEDSGDGAQPSGDASCGADLQTDPANCGACGHDCIGGACLAGQCQAWTLVPGVFGSAEIALDATNIYWSGYSNGQILRAAKDGTGVTVLVTESGTQPIGTTIDDTNVYWVDGENPGSVQSIPKSGGDGGATYLTPANLETPLSVAVDSQNIYWAEYYGNAIGRANKLDGGGFGYIATGLNSPFAVTAGDASVFFGTQDTVGRVPGDWPSVATTDDDAGPFATIFTSSTLYVSGMTLAGPDVYWSEANAPGAVVSAPQSGLGSGVPIAIASNETYPWNVAVDATNVYWTAEGPNSAASSNDPDLFVAGYVATCPIAGCPSSGPKMLATGLHNPRGIAVDDVAVYFTIFGNATGPFDPPTEGSVMKIAK